MSQPLSAASFQDPASARVRSSPIAFGQPAFHRHFRRAFHRLCGNACVFKPPRQPSSSAICGPCWTAAAIFPSSLPAAAFIRWLLRLCQLRAAAAILATASAAPSCGSHHRPSASHRRFFHAPEQHPFAPLVMLLRQVIPASAMTQVSRSSPFSSRSVRLRPFRPTFLEEEGRTPHSRQQVISSAPGPWALWGIPLRAAMA